MRLLATALFGMCISMLPLSSVRAQVPAQWQRFKDTFGSFVQSDSIVGASILIMRDGRVLDRLDIGLADRTKGVAVDSATIFHWASITKTLTAISIMQLQERGRLRLDDRVVDYIPELRQVHNPFGAMDSITVRMLLSHTAGFMGGTWPYRAGQAWEPFEPTRWEQLLAMMPYQQIHFRPGSRYGYSNPGFIYLARIIEKITGDAWESHVQKNIFAPLELNHSYFRATPYHLTQFRSHNYSVERDSATHALRVSDHGAEFDPGVTVPNGGWNAPLNDLARYVAFLTNGTGGTVLQRSALEEMWQPGLPMSQGYQSAPDQWMGLSFMIHGTGERRVVGHTGHQANFGSFFFFNPHTRVAVIAAYNTTNNDETVRKIDREAMVQRAAVDLLR
jgi:CubicO group peptidase (beta-lactamase class C family)